MFVSDLREDFFKPLRSHRRVLILVHLDVDAVCAAKILISLLQCDQVPYTLVPVSGRSGLIRAFRENVSLDSGGDDHGLRHVVFINCGGTVDLVQDLGLDEEEDELYELLSKLTLFVADSHRPLDVCNVYNDGQIKLLMKQEADEGIPEYDDIFKDSDDEESEEDEDGNKRKRLDETTILKRRERRLWEEKRNKILFEYQQFSSYGEATALQMYDLAWKLSRDSNELLWLAVVAHTEQLVMGKSDDERNILETESIREHVARLNNQVEAGALAVNCMKIAFDNDLCLSLYRQWSIYESLQHTLYTASKFRIWSLNGRQRLSEFLAELGLPLAQCKQRFSAMDLELRSRIVDIFSSKTEKYRLDRLVRGSFVASFGYRHRFGAADVVMASVALMERGGDDEDSFLRAMDALAPAGIGTLEEGISLAKEHVFGVIMEQVQTFFDLHSVVSAGPFLYVIIKDGAPNAKYFKRPGCLWLLASHTLTAYASMSNKKAQSLPLVLSTPLDESTCLVVGVPPVSDRSKKNLLGKAFEQALKRSNARFRLDYFNTSIIQLKTEDRMKFIDGLVSLLT